MDLKSLQETHSFVHTRDVICKRLDVNSDTSPSASISLKTNAQPNGRQQRIYTSTPKNEFTKQRKSLHRNDSTGLSRFAATIREQICVGGGSAGGVTNVKGQDPTVDLRLKSLIILFGITIIGYRFMALTMPYINNTNVQQLGSFVQAQLTAALDWSDENQLPAKLSPVLCGLVVAVFFYAIVYIDSAVPGVNPPAPFSPRSKRRPRQAGSGLQVNYFCALAAGVMVTVLMYLDF